MSDLRSLQATGRLATGENLVAITRDSGSGTRNAFQSTICLDPSWGVGENIGSRTTSSTNDVLGPNFQPSNKGGSSRVEATLLNHRLAIGHSAAARGASRYLQDNTADVLAVISDLKGGVVAARPSILPLLDGGPDGYNIVGPAVFARGVHARDHGAGGDRPGGGVPGGSRRRRGGRGGRPGGADRRVGRLRARGPRRRRRRRPGGPRGADRVVGGVRLSVVAPETRSQ